MSDLVGNPEDGFSHDEAQISFTCFFSVYFALTVTQDLKTEWQIHPCLPFKRSFLILAKYYMICISRVKTKNRTIVFKMQVKYILSTKLYIMNTIFSSSRCPVGGLDAMGLLKTR